MANIVVTPSQADLNSTQISQVFTTDEPIDDVVLDNTSDFNTAFTQGDTQFTIIYISGGAADATATATVSSTTADPTDVPITYTADRPIIVTPTQADFTYGSTSQTFTTDSPISNITLSSAIDFDLSFVVGSTQFTISYTGPTTPDATTTATVSSSATGITPTDVPITYTAPVPHSITVEKGSADLTSALPGETITVTARNAYPWEAFYRWTAAPTVTFASATSTSTTFTMPNADIIVTAQFNQIKTRAGSPILDAAATIQINSGYTATKCGLIHMAYTDGTSNATGYFNAYVNGVQIVRFMMSKQNGDGNQGTSETILIGEGQTFTFSKTLDSSGVPTRFTPFLYEDATKVYPVPYVDYANPEHTGSNFNTSYPYPAYASAFSANYSYSGAGFVGQTMAGNGAWFTCSGGNGYSVAGWAGYTAYRSATMYSQRTDSRFRISGGIGISSVKVWRLKWAYDDPDDPWTNYLTPDLSLYQTDVQSAFRTSNDTFVTCWTNNPNGPAGIRIQLDGYTIHHFSENTSMNVDQAIWFFSGINQNNTRDRYNAHYIFESPDQFGVLDYMPKERYTGGEWFSANRSTASTAGRGIMERLYSAGFEQQRTVNGGVGTGNPPEFYNSAVWLNDKRIGKDNSI